MGATFVDNEFRIWNDPAVSFAEISGGTIWSSLPWTTRASSTPRL